MPNTVQPDLFADRIRDLGERTPDGETSPKGATGPMQVMPGTAADPGFGLRPATPGDPQDLTRLGREYAKALLQKYGGNATLASAAYNAGPGQVDQWLHQFGDPRTGTISEADWVAKLPFKETQGYTQRVAGAGPAPVQGPTSNPLTPAAPPAAPSTPTGPDYTAPEADAAPTSPGPDPARALALLRLLTPPTHALRPVDYDPWKIQRMGETGPGGQT